MEFFGSEDDSDDGKRIAKGTGQKKAQERITLLVKYLQTIQDK